MINIRLYILIKCITFWNYSKAFIQNTVNYFQNFNYHINDFFSDNTNKWLIVPGHVIPLCFTNVLQAPYDWIYNSKTNILDFGSNNYTEEKIVCKIGWLSTKIKIHDNFDNSDHEFLEDEFFETIRIITTKSYIPTLHTFYTSWCAYKRVWFSYDTKVEFIIINNQGDEISLNLENDNDCFDISDNNKIILENST